MKARAAKPQTADLFADQGNTARLPEAVPITVTPVATGLRDSLPRPALPRPALLSRLKQLWYAVVFADLPALEAAAMLQRLSLAAQAFTPLVSIEPPNALLLEIKGSVHLFGSVQAIHSAIDAAWNPYRLRAQSATAPTTLAALWSARAGLSMCIEDPHLLAGGLAELPLACTCWNLDWLQTLRRMGVTRVGDVLRLPRAGVARRLSPTVVRDLDVALARQPAARRAFIPRERFCERCDFETEVETVAYLQKALEPVIERCARFLKERQAGVQVLELRLRHRVRSRSRVRVGLAGVTSDPCRLQEVMEQRLCRLELPAAVRGMELRSGSLQPLPADSLDVFAGLRRHGRAGDMAPQLVERLRARLGRQAVYAIAPIAEHRPEYASQRVHELQLASLGSARGRSSDVPVGDMPRPVWLLPAPVLLATDAEQLVRQGLMLGQGPERIESGWWDGQDVARDYYRARDPKGANWWVFRERHTRSWYLHGVFA
jgi:protein ImuB